VVVPNGTVDLTIRTGEMPDHIHGIIIIKNHSERVFVESLHATILQNQIKNSHNPISNPQYKITNSPNEHMSLISPKPGSLATIVRLYKSAVSKCVHNTGLYFGWQKSFYDNIIRTDSELTQIKKYIIENPLKWNHDSDNFQFLR
jgi:REP element-mobilizing transposase RayT